MPLFLWWRGAGSGRRPSAFGVSFLDAGLHETRRVIEQWLLGQLDDRLKSATEFGNYRLPVFRRQGPAGVRPCNLNNRRPYGHGHSIGTTHENGKGDATLFGEHERLADLAEVVVVDSDSTDGTVEVVRSHGATLLDFRWRGGFPKKRNWVLKTFRLKTDWVLFLEVDEHMTEPFNIRLGRRRGSSSWERSGPVAGLTLRQRHKYRHLDKVWFAPAYSLFTYVAKAGFLDKQA